MRCSWRCGLVTSWRGGESATSGLGRGLISGGGSSTGFATSFSSDFGFSSMCSTGCWGEGSDII
jgi:hypothetical protein